MTDKPAQQNSARVKRLEALLHEAYEWGFGHKRSCPPPPSNFQKGQPCKCGRDLLYDRVRNELFVTKPAATQTSPSVAPTDSESGSAVGSVFAAAPVEMPEEPDAGADLQEYLDYQEKLRNRILRDQYWIDKFQSALAEQTIRLEAALRENERLRKDAERYREYIRLYRIADAEILDKTLDDSIAALAAQDGQKRTET